MKKLKVYNLVIFLVGLSFLSLGIVLVIKSNLGVSVATSLPYVLSLHFTKVTFGQWNYIAHGFVLMLLVIIIKRLTVKYLMSFVVAFFFGLTIDFFNIILKSLSVSTFIGRLGLFALGSVVISIGVAAFIKSNYPILPFDTFIKEICIEKNIKISKFKTAFDLTIFTTSFLLSLTFFGQVKGIYFGTLISAVILGTMIGYSIRIMDKYIDGKDILPEEKTKLFLNFDFLNT